MKPKTKKSKFPLFSFFPFPRRHRCRKRNQNKKNKKKTKTKEERNGVADNGAQDRPRRRSFRRLPHLSGSPIGNPKKKPKEIHWSPEIRPASDPAVNVAVRAPISAGKTAKQLFLAPKSSSQSAADDVKTGAPDWLPPSLTNGAALGSVPRYANEAGAYERQTEVAIVSV